MSIPSHDAESILSQIDWLRQAVLESSGRTSQLEEQLRSEKLRHAEVLREHQARVRALQQRAEGTGRQVSDLEAEIEARAHEILGLKAELERAVGEVLRMREILRQASSQEREGQRERELLVQEAERRARQASRQRQIDLEGILERDRALAERDLLIAELREELERARGAGPAHPSR